MVVRQPGDLLQKLLQSSAILPTLAEGSPIPVLTPPPAPPPSLETPDHQQQLQQQQQQELDSDDLNELKSEDDINRTLDELLNESYDKMGIGEQHTSYQEDHNDVHHQQQQQQQNLFESIGHHQQNPLDMTAGTSSSTDAGMIEPQIENLCLMSPHFDSEEMDVIDSIKLDLLYN